MGTFQSLTRTVKVSYRHSCGFRIHSDPLHFKLVIVYRRELSYTVPGSLCRVSAYLLGVPKHISLEKPIKPLDCGMLYTVEFSAPPF
jgi:hypothetical protein